MIKANTTGFGHIGVLMGGYSSEREISLKSGKAIFEALKTHGCRVSPIDILLQDEEAILSLLMGSQIDVAFIALHGHLGEDGVIQSIIEKMNIPYTGSGVEASRLALNKVSAQAIFKKNQIPIPGYEVVSRGQRLNIDKLAGQIGRFPVVVKPSSQGSSIGIALVEDKRNLHEAIAKAFEYDGQVLIEQYIDGKELTVGILGQDSLPVIEIKPKAKFFDFTAKYQSAGATEYIVPAQLPKEVSVQVQKVAYQAHEALGCCDFSRVDVMLDKNNNSYILEVNTIPGFTATSLLPKAAMAAGMDFTQLCLKLVELAYKKQKRPQGSLV